MERNSQLRRQSCPARSHRDFADAVEFIRIHNLGEACLTKLYTAVRREFMERLEEKRREDEYEAREG
jgi:hypothetical protein